MHTGEQTQVEASMQAAVLSGSGCSSTAAYEIGVMKALMEGGLANLGSANRGSLSEKLLSIPAMTPLFDMAPLQSQLRKYVDLDRLRRSSKELMVIATDWARGMPRIFTSREMTDELGYKVLQASAAFTLAFPFVQIYGRRFSGGPGTMATPLKPVIESYAPRTRRLTIHAIFLDPAMKDIPIEKMDSALGGLGRWFTLNESVNIRADVEYASGDGPPNADSVTELREAAGETSVVIHRYRPKKPIVDWFEFANFDRDKTEGYIRQGYDETLRHICKAEGCTFEGGRP